VACPVAPKNRDGTYEIAAVYDLNTNVATKFHIAEMSFCNGATHLTNGSLIIVGGEFVSGIPGGQLWWPQRAASCALLP
jgi:hypothetical protein